LSLGQPLLLQTRCAQLTVCRACRLATSVNVLTCLALPCHSTCGCLPAAGKHAARIMHIFTPQSIANLLWSYATLDLCPETSLLHVSWVVGSCAVLGFAVRAV
jgi:hypothetical protein